MSEVKVILSLQTEQVAKQAAEAGKTMESMARKTSQTMQDEAVRTEKAVVAAAEQTVMSEESVQDAMGEVSEGLQEIGEQAKTASASAETGMRQTEVSLRNTTAETKRLVFALGGISPIISIIGQLLMGLVTGPIALIAAAVTAVITGVTFLWDAATMNANEYLKVLNSVLDLQGEATRRTEEQFAAVERYLSRLEEIDAMENKGNAAKEEQARLLELLTKRYGDLGIIIDEDTGKLASFDELTGKSVYGLENARANLNRLRRADLSDSLVKELATSEEKLGRFDVDPGFYHNLASTLTSTSAAETLQEILNRAENAEKGNAIARQLGMPEIGMGSVRQSQRDDLAEFLKREYLPEEETIDQLNAYLAALDQNLDIRQKIATVAETGYTTESDYVSSLSEATAREQAQAAGRTSNPPVNSPDPEETKLKGIRDAVQGVIDRYQMLKREQELIADGKEREAVIEKETMALRRRAAQMGVELTQEQIDSMEEAVGSWYDYMQSVKQTEPETVDRTAELEQIAGEISAMYRPDAPGMVTNSLVARGGSAAGIRMPDLERYQRATSESTARLVELTEEQKRLIAEGALI